MLEFLVFNSSNVVLMLCFLVSYVFSSFDTISHASDSYPQTHLSSVISQNAMVSHCHACHAQCHFSGVIGSKLPSAICQSVNLSPATTAGAVTGGGIASSSKWTIFWLHSSCLSCLISFPMDIFYCISHLVSSISCSHSPPHHFKLRALHVTHIIILMYIQT